MIKKLKYKKYVKKLFKYIFFIILICLSNFTLSKVYNLPQKNSRLIGSNTNIKIPSNNKLPLEYFASKYQIGLTNILEANKDLDVFLPSSINGIIIPHQLILPDTPHQGIIINSSEMRLYYYPKNKNNVVVFPIGIGELGSATPTNWITSIKYKKSYPTWIPTKKIRKEYISKGINLPKIFPSGPSNPMGLYALYVGNLYAIHGTNVNFGIGLRVSHGCVRLRNNDIKWLFRNVPVGTRVQFIDQPVKTTIEPNGSIYIEIHNPLSTKKNQFKLYNENLMSLIKKKLITINNNICKDKLNDAIKKRNGLPTKINGFKCNINYKVHKN